jgi:hypothetical protein
VHLVGSMCNWTKMHGIHGIKKVYPTFKSLCKASSLRRSSVSPGEGSSWDWLVVGAQARYSHKHLRASSWLINTVLCISCTQISKRMFEAALESRCGLHTFRWYLNFASVFTLLLGTSVTGIFKSPNREFRLKVSWCGEPRTSTARQIFVLTEGWPDWTEAQAKGDKG